MASVGLTLTLAVDAAVLVALNARIERCVRKFNVIFHGHGDFDRATELGVRFSAWIESMTERTVRANLKVKGAK